MKGYTEAIKCLNELQTNHSVIQTLHKNWQQFKTKRSSELMPEMHEYIRRIGYTSKDFNKLNAVHVTGTKGKGSTCAFVESILSQYSASKHLKLGLYTSPHLIHVRERIMIDSVPLSEEKFAQYFFEVQQRLENSSSNIAEFPNLGPGAMPMYFRYLTLMSFHAFMQENVNAAIYEVGIGGEYDSTNVFSSVAACGVSSLGIDHENVLGSTIEEIAWNKSGIFKPDCPAYTLSSQPEAALEVMRQRATEKKVSKFEVLNIHPHVENIQLGLHGKFQVLNATLACYLAAERLGITLDSKTLPPQFVAGLQQAKWAGRCQRVDTKSANWFLDGAHTTESLEVAAEWFAKTADLSKPVTLVFNQQKRDNVDDLLTGLSKTLTICGVNVQHAVFTTNKSTKSGYALDMVSHNVSKKQVDELTIQNQLARVWKSLHPKCKVSVCSNLTDTVDLAKGQVLATGSLLMVGGILSQFENECIY